MLLYRYFTYNTATTYRQTSNDFAHKMQRVYLDYFQELFRLQKQILHGMKSMYVHKQKTTTI